MIIPSAGKQGEQLELSHIADGHIKCYNQFRKQFGNFLLSKIIQLPTISLLCIYPREVKTRIHKSQQTNIYNIFIQNSYKLEIPQSPSMN